MTKAELIDRVQEVTGQSKKVTGEIIDAVFDAVADAIQQQGRFSYPSFGTFNVRERGPRTGRNPQTKETIQIPASKTVAFKAAPALKEKL